MLKKIPALQTMVLLLSLSTITGFSQQSTLPNAPEAIAKRKWSDVVEPGEKVPPLYAKDKLMFPVHEELRLTSWTPTFLSAGWGQLRDSDPRYGRDSGAFGERLGAAAIRDLSMRTFSDGVLPALTHEDPRYFRMGHGGFLRRMTYAVSRVAVTRTDAGSNRANYSEFLGAASAAGIANLYYPADNRTVGYTMQNFGVQLASGALFNMLKEFWPDVRHKHPRRSAPGFSDTNSSLQNPTVADHAESR